MYSRKNHVGIYLNFYMYHRSPSTFCFTRSELSSYYENVNRQSKTFKDRIVSPLNAAVYWIEYIMRYEETSHLRSASLGLMWYQYYLLDVWILLISLLSITAYTFYTIAKLSSKVFVSVLNPSVRGKKKSESQVEGRRIEKKNS